MTQNVSSRALRPDERSVLAALIPDSNAALHQQLSNAVVQDMADGGMGGIRFVRASDNKDEFWKAITTAEFVDDDGIVVSVALHIDKGGRLMELDFWKVDFSVLRKYPTPEELVIKVPDTIPAAETQWSVLSRLWPSDIPISALWKYILGGIVVIFLFWVTWVPLSIFLGLTDFFFISGALGGGWPTQTIHDCWRLALYCVILGVITAVSVAVWKSVARTLALRNNRPIAAGVATACALLAGALMAGVGETARVMTWLYGNEIIDTYDSLRTSANAAKRIKLDPTFPFSGFWQTSCGDDVGVSIERESRLFKLYRLESCSRFSCFGRDDSKIAGDPKYRIIDSDTIEFDSLMNPMLYHRCG